MEPHFIIFPTEHKRMTETVEEGNPLHIGFMSYNGQPFEGYFPALQCKWAVPTVSTLLSSRVLKTEGVQMRLDEMRQIRNRGYEMITPAEVLLLFLSYRD